LAKIAVELDEGLAEVPCKNATGRLTSRVLAQGAGWEVAEAVCTAGPQDRPYEERHSDVAIAIVVSGTFQYRNNLGRELMTPGSLFLGNAGQYFECGHEHGAGDRCISFRYSPQYFERLAADAGGCNTGAAFQALRLPPLRSFSGLVAAACAGLVGTADTSWEEFSVQLAVKTLTVAHGLSVRASNALPSALARATRVVRMIERDPESSFALGTLAEEAGLSPYHFLRTFQQLTGVTPHQYVRRARLRAAAVRLASGSDKVLDVAFDSGFGDVSNFNRAFRTEFGASPLGYRMRAVSRKPFPQT
jgi:AraC family transcriptional regulator